MSYTKFNKAVNDYLILCKRNNISTRNHDAVVRDQWIADKKYNELIGFIIDNWDSGNCDDFVLPFTKHLIEYKELFFYKKLWKGIINNRLQKLWQHYADFKKMYPNFSLEQIRSLNIEGFNQFSSSESNERRIAWERNFTINGIQEFIAGLKVLGDDEEIKVQMGLLDSVSNLNRPKPKPSTDKRKIDETLFWQLIEEAQIISESKSFFVDNLKSALERFTSKEIKNFDRILKAKASELNRWEHWALAYIVRKGCGDDAFDYFRIWVVSKGKNVFESIKNLEEGNLVELFNEDPQLEELLYTAEEVYESKTFEPIRPIRGLSSKLVGKKWTEAGLQSDFPALCKLFNYS